MAKYDVVVIGASAGGSEALMQILPGLPATFPVPVVIVQHLHPLQEGTAMLYRGSGCSLTLKEANDKEALRTGFVYFAPPNYHLLIEDDKTFSLSVDPRVHFTRPAIDVMFDSAVDAFGQAIVGIVLSGANQDGAQGLARIERRGGVAVVQEPQDAQVSYMPGAAIQATRSPHILKANQIAGFLKQLFASM